MLPVAGDIGRAWSQGKLGDKVIVHLARCNTLPCPVCLVVLRVDGNAAGMRALFAFLSRLICREGVQVAGFACRTRLVAVERVFKRFDGRVSWDEGDGDCRWWAPAEPACGFLQLWRFKS